MSFVALPSYVCLAGCMPVPNWVLSSLTPQIHLVPNYPTLTELYLDLVCGAVCRLAGQVFLYRVLGSHAANHPFPRSLALTSL